MVYDHPDGSNRPPFGTACAGAGKALEAEPLSLALLWFHLRGRRRALVDAAVDVIVETLVADQSGAFCLVSFPKRY